MSNNMENKIKNVSGNNPIFYSRIGELDLIASEIKYHASCFATESRKTSSDKKQIDFENEALQQLFSEMEKVFQKGKGYSTISVSKRYREIGGEIDLSDRLLIKKV